MAKERERLGQILKRKNLLTGTKLVRALDQQKLHGQPLGAILVQEGMLSEDDLLLALQEQFGTPIIDLGRAPINFSAVGLVPQQFATEHLLLPITFINVAEGSILVVAMENPNHKELIQKIHEKTGYPIKPMLAGRMRLIEAIAEAYRTLRTSGTAST